MSERHQFGVRADAIPLSSDPSASADEHPLFRKEYTVESGSTYTKVLDETERATVEESVLRFYPTFRELSKIPVYQAASVTVHGTCYKKDLNTVLLAEFNDRNPVFGSLEKIWLCSTYIFFGLKLYQTVDFTANLNAYEIQDEDLPSGLFIIEVQGLFMASILHIYKHDGKMYLCPREDLNALLDD